MKEQITDALLRQQVAQWTRTALGPLVEDNGLNEPALNMEKTLSSQWDSKMLTSLARFNLFLKQHAQRGACVLLSEAARPVRFFCTGGAAGLLQLGLLAILANVVASLLTTQVNFVLSFLFTWYDRRPGRTVRQASLIRWLSYQGVSLGTLLLNQLVFVVAHRVLPLLVAAELGLAVGAGVNFVVMHRFVFRKSGVSVVPKKSTDQQIAELSIPRQQVTVDKRGKEEAGSFQSISNLHAV